MRRKWIGVSGLAVLFGVSTFGQAIPPGALSPDKPVFMGGNQVATTGMNGDLVLALSPTKDYVVLHQACSRYEIVERSSAEEKECERDQSRSENGCRSCQVAGYVLDGKWQPRRSPRTPGTFPQAVPFFVDVGGGATDLTNLPIVLDRGTFVDSLNGTQVRERELDNTAAVSNLPYDDERSLFSVRLGSEGLRVKRLSIEPSATIGIGTSDLNFTTATGTTLTLRGDVRSVQGIANFQFAINEVFSVGPRVGYAHVTMRDVTQTPSPRITGGVLASESYDIKSSQWTAGAAARFTRGPVRLSLGGEYYNAKWDIARQLNVDFSQTFTGAAQRFDGVTKLEQDGIQGTAGVQWNLSRRFGLLFETAFDGDRMAFIGGTRIAF